MWILMMANEILQKSCFSEVNNFPGLEEYLIRIEDNVQVLGGSVRSRQVVALAIETWFLVNKVE